jgi:hypothetical protein
MIKGLNLVQREDSALGDSHTFLLPHIPEHKLNGCPEPLGLTSLAETRLQAPWFSIEKPLRRRASPEMTELASGSPRSSYPSWRFPRPAR